MKKSTIILIILACFLVFVPNISAKEIEEGAAETERWVCLQNQHCWNKAIGFEACSTPHRGNGHFARLSAKPGFEPLVGQPTYIVECFATEGGQLCTTGNEQADIKVYCQNDIAKCQGGKTNLTKLKEAPFSYTFNGLFLGDGSTTVTNPAEWAGPYEWGDATPQSHMRTWYALNYWDPTQTAVGAAGGQQLGTFDFETAEKDCVKIGWDPYGRVFDAMTLEPISGAQVTLQVKKAGVFVNMTTLDVVGGNLINPQITLEDGNFNFVVPDGDYKLITVPAAVTDIAGVDVNYSKAYSDIYPSTTGEEIQQRGAIQHRDIPVVTQNTNNPVKMIEYFHTTTPQGIVILEGRVSHPLTQLNVNTSKLVNGATEGEPYRTIMTAYADKLGKFKIEVEQGKLEITEEYVEVFSDLELVKVDLREPLAKKTVFDHILSLSNKIIHSIYAQTTLPLKTSVKIEPIPQYLEGYAYDENGKEIPNAVVKIYLKFSNSPYSKKQADETGFYKFTSEYLPNQPYEIRYTTPNGTVIKTSTTKFLAQNRIYLTEKKINPFVGRDQNANIASQIRKNPTLTSKGYDTSLKNKADISKKDTKTNNSLDQKNIQIVTFIIILLLLVGGVVGIIFYMKKTKSASLTGF